MDRTKQLTTLTRPQLSPWILPQAAQPGSAAERKMQSQAAGFDPISLKQMDAVALLNRIDAKFVLTTGQLLGALAAVQPDYWMLCIDGQRLNHYRTLYFDTPDFALYNLHVNDRAERYKVRSREYVDSHLAFMEVKHKTRKDRTIKDRIRTEKQAMQVTPEIKGWLQEVYPLDSEALEPKLLNTFTRMTLVSQQYCERVTLDINLTFYAADRAAQLNGIAIAEVKMDANNGASPFLAQMRAQRVRQQGFSKYSMGVSMLYDQVKKNALKPKMLRIEKMMKGMVYNERAG